MKKALAIFSILIMGQLKAQYLDTLHEVFTHKSNVTARLESRYSVINNQITSVTGIRLGVAFQRKLRLGGGISWLKTEYSKTLTDVETGGQSRNAIRYLKFGYMCFYADFVFHKTKRWQLSVPIQAGMGMIWYQKEVNYRILGKDSKYGLFIYEPGITVQFKVFKWFALGSDVAYRFALKNNKKISERLSSPTYSLKIIILFDQLFYVMFPESKLAKEKGPAIW